MSADPTLTRRTVLVAAAATAGAAALAACASSDSNDGRHAAIGGDNDTGTSPTTGGATTTPSNTASSSATRGGNAGSTDGTPLATLVDVPVGSAISVTLPDGQPGIVARPTDTTAAAFSAICTHMQCTVAPQGAKLVCPCHGSVYNALTGAVEQGPAPQALAKVSVTVANGEVLAT